MTIREILQRNATVTEQIAIGLTVVAGTAIGITTLLYQLIRGGR